MFSVYRVCLVLCGIWSWDCWLSCLGAPLSPRQCHRGCSSVRLTVLCRSGWGKVDLCRSKSTGKALRIYSPILTYDLKISLYSLFGALRNMVLGLLAVVLRCTS
ncbi:hypothetical protein CFP56_011049 [Quercus suber]|uniref:Secreted protein n=1 Tax=Quercus suber TaxID=58331 RepID=A0AAW0KY85_QUESU